MTEEPEDDTPVTAPVGKQDARLHYVNWQNDPSAENLHNVVKALDPVVKYKLGALGVADNPHMKHQAKLFTAQAVKSYDPASGVGLITWTQQNLQNMNRYKRENNGPVKVADRAALDAWTLEKASRELEDKLGREPDVKELADFTKMPPKRIAKVRLATRPVAATEQMHTFGEEPTDYMSESLDYLYDELDAVDRKIIEHTTGYGGAEQMQKNQIAAKLGISAAQVTRRAERIGQRLQEIESDLDQTF